MKHFFKIFDLSATFFGAFLYLFIVVPVVVSDLKLGFKLVVICSLLLSGWTMIHSGIKKSLKYFNVPE